MDERTPALRRALVDAIAGAHRLQQQAVAEEREVERWLHRAAYAEERGMTDLAVEARTRAGRHTNMAHLFDQRAAEMRAEVQRLRAEVDTAAVGGRPPPMPVAPVDALEARLAELEVERELDRLRTARANNRPVSPPD